MSVMRRYRSGECGMAGYYAWTYLGLELDREQVTQRLDELLGLELAA